MLTVAPALLFGAVTVMQLRNRNIRALEAAIVFLFAFFLAETGLGHTLATLLNQLLGIHNPPAPTPVPPVTATPGGGVPV